MGSHGGAPWHRIVGRSRSVLASVHVRLGSVQGIDPTLRALDPRLKRSSGSRGIESTRGASCVLPHAAAEHGAAQHEGEIRPTGIGPRSRRCLKFE